MRPLPCPPLRGRLSPEFCGRLGPLGSDGVGAGNLGPVIRGGAGIARAGAGSVAALRLPCVPGGGADGTGDPEHRLAHGEGIGAPADHFARGRFASGRGGAGRDLGGGRDDYLRLHAGRELGHYVCPA